MEPMTAQPKEEPKREFVRNGKVSMLKRIKNAKDLNELDKCLEEACTYEYASANTKMKWGRAEEVRRAELEEAAQ